MSLVFSLVAALLIAPAAEATVLLGDAIRPLPPRYQQWANDALVPTPRGIVFVSFSVCPDATDEPACARPPNAIHMAPHERGQPTFFHELGHIYDFKHLDEHERREYQRLTGTTALPWCGGDDWTEPCEAFAGDYALCAAGIGHPPACRFIRRAYR